jgi:hypothetical protein
VTQIKILEETVFCTTTKRRFLAAAAGSGATAIAQERRWGGVLDVTEIRMVRFVSVCFRF